MTATSIDRNTLVMDEILQRLRRMETKLVIGFESIGVDTYGTRDWLSVDNTSSTLHISTLGRSLQVINDAAKALGAKEGRKYAMVWRGDMHGTIHIY